MGRTISHSLPWYSATSATNATTETLHHLVQQYMHFHNGPWFCESCKGVDNHVVSVPDVTQDWPLIDHLWTGWLPQDMDKANQLRQSGGGVLGMW